MTASGVLDERFDGAVLREDRWVAHYLPQWTTPERSAARFDLTPDGLRLRIDADQPDWRPEDGAMRVSNLQTGLFSGPVGSARGTSRHRDDGLLVRTDVGTRLLWAPTAGRLDVTVSASPDPDCMTAVWLVGSEHRSPDESGEICVCEIDGRTAGPDASLARSGIKARHDPRLHDDMAEVVLPLDATRPHTWSTRWGGGRTTIRCEGRVVRSMDQAPDHPLLLMLDLFEFGPRRGAYPKTATIHRVEGRASGP